MSRVLALFVFGYLLASSLAPQSIGCGAVSAPQSVPSAAVAAVG